MLPTAGMHGNSRHRMHVWLGNVFDDNRNVVVPSSNGLVVRCRQESTVAVHKSNGVDRSKMLVVCLHNLSLPRVVLVVNADSSLAQGTHLNDLLVLHTGHEDVLFVAVRVELDHIWYLPVRERKDAFTRFRVPHLDLSIK